MKQNIDKWYSKICGQYATGVISSKLFRKHQSWYEAKTKKAGKGPK